MDKQNLPLASALISKGDAGQKKRSWNPEWRTSHRKTRRHVDGQEEGDVDPEAVYL